jgi:hypothetical protein
MGTGMKNHIAISLTFLREPDSDFLAKAQQISMRLEENSGFPNLQPPLEEVRSKIEAFRLALADSSGGGREKTALKNDARAVLVASLRALAHHVENHAAGDLTAIISTGFSARKGPQRAGILPAPSEMLLKPTIVPGQIAVRLRPVPNVAAYEVHTNPSADQEAGWASRGAFTSSRIMIDGFTPGHICWVRVRSLGAAGAGPWSGASSVRVG